MTVSTEVSREEYTGNGVTTDFDYRFRVFSAEDLVVSVADTTETISVLTLNTDYTVTGAGSRNGGKVKLSSPLAFNWRISIERELPVTQETDIRNQGNFFPEVHEDAFDKLTMLIQQAWSYFGLALRKPTWLAKYYDAQGNRIANLGNPINPQDAATKSYVDNEVANSNIGWQAGDAALNSKIDANFNRTLRVPESYVQPLASSSARSNMLLGFNNIGAPVPIASQTETADLAIKLASTSGGEFVRLASGRTVQDKSTDILSIMDTGYSKDLFDADGVDAANKSGAIQSRIPYIGSKQFALPQQSLKAWTYLDGYKERGAVVSFMNTPSPNSPEPVTQVLGISSAAGLGQYSDRDFVGVFTQIEGPPSLLTTSATTFTATTVTSSDINSISIYLRAGQIIDVKDAVDTTKTYSGLIKSLSGTTVTVDTAWYLKGGGGTVTGIPTTGSTAAFVPNTKLWAHNANVVLNPNSQATSIVGFELGMINKKIDNYVGYGYDCVNLGPYGIGNAFQARNKFNIGFASYSGKNFGFTSFSAATNGFYSSGDNVGFQTQNSASYGVQIKNPGEYALIVQSGDNSFRTGMDANGRWQALKLYSQVASIGSTITQYASVVFATPAANGDIVSLPLPSTASNRTMYVRNLSATYILYLSGSYEGGVGGISVVAKNTIQLFSDGTYWYPLSKYSA
ncbi:hypothetical protein ABQ381_12565 [Serratia fonticola]|uniref:hypothetical protein n=1 Tax=Serratia fonticola TaxID=47917 RepID=UPI003AACA9AB|nr:hypothetical protein [Serratia fonticola]